VSGAHGALRVLHVIEAMHQGGAESLVVEHARHAGPEVEVVVCALNRGGPALEAARPYARRVLVLGGDPRQRGPARPLAVLARLAALLREERVDVVNGHNPAGGLYAALAGVLARVPVVVRTEHSLHYRKRYSRVYPLLEPVSTTLTRRVVCVCQAVLHSHVSRSPWVARRFVNVANGISSAPHTRPREQVRGELILPPGARVVLTIGSLTRQKAQHLLLEAFAVGARLVPDACLLIAGEGPLQADLEARRDALGLGDRVRFLGPRLDVPDLLEAADVFALSSEREGLPVTLLEALRAGRPAVATDVGGCAEILGDGACGVLVPAGGTAALGAALAGLLADPGRAAALGRAGRARWAERYTAERMVRETEAIYRAELARARRGPARGALAAEARHASS